MSNHWYTISSLDDLAGYFSQKAREMNDISQQRTGLVKHNYAGQAHAYNDAAAIVRSCKMDQKGRKRNVKQHNNTDSSEPKGKLNPPSTGPKLPPES